MEKREKIKVVTLKKALEILEVSKAYFFKKYKKDLTDLPFLPNDPKKYYKYEEILDVKKERELQEKETNNFEIIG